MNDPYMDILFWICEQKFDFQQSYPKLSKTHTLFTGEIVSIDIGEHRVFTLCLALVPKEYQDKLCIIPVEVFQTNPTKPLRWVEKRSERDDALPLFLLPPA